MEVAKTRCSGIYGAEDVGKHHDLTTGIVYLSPGFTLCYECNVKWELFEDRGSMYDVQGAIVDF